MTVFGQNLARLLIVLVTTAVCGNVVRLADDKPALATDDNNKLIVQVYYEALCYDSMLFFKRWTAFWQRNAAYIDLRLVPYGKAIHNRNPSTGKWMFDCQHGRAECELNMVHACILDKLPANESLVLIACNMDPQLQSNVAECATKHELNLDSVNNCVASEADELLVGHGNQTHLIQPSFVPTVVADQTYNWDTQRDWLRHFDSQFCAAYEHKFGQGPTECSASTHK